MLKRLLSAFRPKPDLSSAARTLALQGHEKRLARKSETTKALAQEIGWTGPSKTWRAV